MNHFFYVQEEIWAAVLQEVQKVRTEGFGLDCAMKCIWKRYIVTNSEIVCERDKRMKWKVNQR